MKEGKIMKIFFYALRDYDELPCAEKYSREYGIPFGWTSAYPSADNYGLMKGYDAFCCLPCDMSEPVIDKLHEEGIQYVLARSIGYDHLNFEAMKKYGMRAANVSYPPETVANYAIMLMMMAARKAKEIMNRADAQDYSLKGKLGRDISGMTVGVIGTGRIGSTVIQHLSGFGCRILCYDPYPREENKKYAEYVDLDTLYKECDGITLHANATKENEHLLNEAAFAKMKRGMIIVNTSRGKLIDTDALIHALKDEIVGGAALDVLENENDLYYYNRSADLIDNDEMAILRSFPNVLLMPHTAFYTEVVVDNMVKSCFEAAAAFEKGEPTYHELKF